MTVWADLQGEVYKWTNRPDRVNETNLALRNAIRTAHKSGRYWRDLAKVTVTPTGLDLQTIDLSVVNKFSQLAYLKDPDGSTFYDAVGLGELVDEYNRYKTDICYGFGNAIMVRAASPLSAYELGYYKYPGATETDLDSWILNEHQDLIILWAASQICGLVGESEIKNTVDRLAIAAFAQLQQDGLEILGR